MYKLIVTLIFSAGLAACSTTSSTVFNEKERAIAPDEQLLTMASHYEKAMELEKAFIYYFKALENNPDDITLLYRLADINMRLGKDEFAAQMLNRVLKLEPNHINALTQLGLIHLRNKQLHEARAYLTQATLEDKERIERTPEYANNPMRLDGQSPIAAYNGLAVAYDLMGKHEQALELYNLRLALEPASAVTLTNLGYSNYLAGDLLNAVKYFQRAIDAAPDYKRAWTNLGLVYSRMGRYNKAFRTLSRVMTEAQAYNDLGYFLMLDKRYAEAEHFFEQAINTSPVFYEIAHENLTDLRHHISMQGGESELLP